MILNWEAVLAKILFFGYLELTLEALHDCPNIFAKIETYYYTIHNTILFTGDIILCSLPAFYLLIMPLMRIIGHVHSKCCG